MHCAVTLSLTPMRSASSRRVMRQPPRAATVATMAENNAFERGVSIGSCVLMTCSSHRILCGHADINLHALEGRCSADEGPGYRHRLRRIAGGCDTNEVVGGYKAVGRIELDPPGARQIDFRPGMGSAAAGLCAAIVRCIVEITGDEAGAEAEAAHRLDQKKREIPA